MQSGSLQNPHVSLVPVCTSSCTSFLRRRRIPRNLRIVRLSIFNKLLIALDLRMDSRVRVLPEEPFFQEWSPPANFPECPRNVRILWLGHKEARARRSFFFRQGRHPRAMRTQVRYMEELSTATTDRLIPCTTHLSKSRQISVGGVGVFPDCLSSRGGKYAGCRKSVLGWEKLARRR